MKHRSLLLLLEICIMLGLLFTVAAVCLAGLGKANEISRKADDLAKSAVLCENVCEILRQSGGDTDKAYAFARENLPEGLSLTVEKTASDSVYIEKALVLVSRNGEEVFSMHVAWQKGGSHE